jgi:hypothetical protein
MNNQIIPEHDLREESTMPQKYKNHYMNELSAQSTRSSGSDHLGNSS